jgi:hypothetical protein
MHQREITADKDRVTAGGKRTSISTLEALRNMHSPGCKTSGVCNLKQQAIYIFFISSLILTGFVTRLSVLCESLACYRSNVAVFISISLGKNYVSTLQ